MQFVQLSANGGFLRWHAMGWWIGDVAKGEEDCRRREGRRDNVRQAADRGHSRGRGKSQKGEGRMEGRNGD